VVNLPPLAHRSLPHTEWGGCFRRLPVPLCFLRQRVWLYYTLLGSMDVVIKKYPLWICLMTTFWGGLVNLLADFGMVFYLQGSISPLYVVGVTLFCLVSSYMHTYTRLYITFLIPRN
jgi:hypothetical protein